MRTIPSFLPAFTGSAEALRLKVYPDSKGVPTIGYGATGPDVFFGMADWTTEQAQTRLKADLEKHAALLYKRVKSAIIESWTDHQYGALADFVFNTGAGPDWTIWKILNRGITGEPVTNELKRFDKIKHKDGTSEIVPGLDHRRAAEVTLYNTADGHPAMAIAMAKPPIEIAATTPPSSEIRAASTPPATASAKPLASSKSFIASCGAAACTAATTAVPLVSTMQEGIGHTLHALAPFTGGSETVAAWVASLTTLAAVLAVAVPLLIAIKNRESNV